MKTSEDLRSALDTVDWDDPHRGPQASRQALRALAANRALLTELVEAVPRKPELMRRCEQYPVMSRLVLAEHPHGTWGLRMHIFHGVERDLIPHTHKRPFASHILAGGYLHAWHRRTDHQSAGPFTAADLTPAIVSLEAPGSDYTLQDPLVHQTIMDAGTVTLFLSGPDRQPTWWAATDMGGEVQLLKQDDKSNRSFAMTPDGHTAIATMLSAHGIINGRTAL
ncbi:hypothetical protein [Kitasatospora sp. NPDC057015]|uniref:hypothetical protein n=1 Tax=Kitasatospora sp. NPDC057015 TaxID=3346001 RepID=UPI00362DCEC5